MEKPTTLTKAGAKHINTTMSPADIARLDKAAEKLATTKGRLIKAVMLDWLDAFEADNSNKE